MAKKKAPVKKSLSGKSRAPVPDWSAVEKILEAWERIRAAEKKEGKK